MNSFERGNLHLMSELRAERIKANQKGDQKKLRKKNEKRFGD